ncbi:MAG: hypothetical protein HKM24_00315, partial [Gammaproteobacteria bacterium]|nr:hypothetical protein [Gammaproteobacteria bacterium]
PYGIPSTNPFASSSGCNDAGCREIYAWGFRNPFRWSFDMSTGDLWAGDVGQDSYEEVDVVELGGNYGWRIREGAHCFNPSSGCSTAGLIDPITEYPHSGAQSITGGFVYRGSDIPLLEGKYVFGDYESGRVWALLDDGSGGLMNELIDDVSFNVIAFGQDHDGEIYALNFLGGTIYKLMNDGSTGGSGAADKLSNTGCVNPADPTQPASGMVPYEPNAAFWSDNAVKSRWLAIPDGTTIDINTENDFDFPAGSVLMKNFKIDDELVETRLLMHHPDGTWAGYSYEWNDAGTDADLLSGSKTKNVGSQDWYYPSSTQCSSCHTPAAGISLGLEIAQLNKDLNYPSTGNTANQLATLEHVNMLTQALPDIPANLPRFASPLDISESLLDRSRAYLHVNCSQCHRPTGPTPSDIDFRATTSLVDSNACNIAPTFGNLGITSPLIIAPGDQASSVLINRMDRRDANGMPPLGSLIVDDFGVALMQSWMNGLVNCN